MIVEVRKYTIKPGLRARFIDFFEARAVPAQRGVGDRKSTRLNSSHVRISYAVFCLKKKMELPSTGQHNTELSECELKICTCLPVSAHNDTRYCGITIVL